jgi:methyl-accepting chemotaxis protein
VVAGEVKSLAEQTAHSSNAIADTIAHIEANTAAATGAVRDIAAGVDTIDQVLTDSRRFVNRQRATVAALNAQLGAASRHVAALNDQS